MRREIFDKYPTFGTLALVDSNPWPLLEAEERTLLVLLVKARGRSPRVQSSF